MSLMPLQISIEELINEYFFSLPITNNEILIINKKIIEICKKHNIYYKSRRYGPWCKYHLASFSVAIDEYGFIPFKVNLRILVKAKSYELIVI